MNAYECNGTNSIEKRLLLKQNILQTARPTLRGKYYADASFLEQSSEDCIKDSGHTYTSG